MTARTFHTADGRPWPAEGEPPYLDHPSLEERPGGWRLPLPPDVEPPAMEPIMDRLITRPAASLERKVVGGSLAGFLTIIALAALEYFVPEEAADLAPAAEIAAVYLATLIGSYMTRSKMPVPVESSQPVE